MIYFKTIVFTIFIILSSYKVNAQKHVEYTLVADANALMCPFLSPQLMDRLTKLGGADVTKDASLQIHFTTTVENEISDERILKLVEDVGYQSKLFSISRRYED